MKRIFLLLFIVMGVMTSIQAQFVAREISKKDVNVNNDKIRKAIRKAPVELSASDLVGVYSAYGESAFANSPDEEWTVEITQDASNENILWIRPICLFAGLSASSINAVYAEFDAAEGLLIMPMGQILYGGPDQQYNMVIATVDMAGQPSTSGDLLMNVALKGNKLTISSKILMGVGNVNANEWWYQAFRSFSFSMELETSPVNVFVKDEAEPIPFESDKIFFQTFKDTVFVTDAPLQGSAVDGVYEAFAESALANTPSEEWTMNITIDEKDPNKIWISPILLFSDLPSDMINPVYAIFDAKTNTFSLPLGQTLFGGPSSLYHIILGTNTDSGIVTEGNLTLYYINNGKNSAIICNDIIGCGDVLDANGWWYQALLGFVAVAGPNYAIPVEEVEKITKSDNAQAPQDMFFNEGSY